MSTRLPCAGTEEYYRSARETVLVYEHRDISDIQKSSIRALGKLRWYNRVL